MTVSPRRYLAIVMPMLPSERIARRRHPGGPFVLVAKQRGAMRIVARDAAAATLGVGAGMALADARASFPDLIAVDADPAADALFLEWLADGCERYTPMLAIEPPDALLLDLTGCTHGYADGEKGVAHDIAVRLARIGLTMQHAFAGSPDTALALARHGIADPRALPVAALRLSEETHLALVRAGLKRIGDLVGRSSAALAARFGIDLPTRLDRLLEREDRRITPRRRPPDIIVEARFAEPVSRTPHILDIIRALVGEAAVLLAERGAGGRRFAITLFRSDGHIARLCIETAAPVRDPALLDRLFAERLDSLADPLDPGFGYDLIRLDVPTVQSIAVDQPGLEGKSSSTPPVAALIDRLVVRLGGDRLRLLALAETHIPERYSVDLSIAGPADPACWPDLQADDPPLHPCQLFHPPQPVDAVMAEVPDGPPHRFRWRGQTHGIVRHEGPERIATEWWRRAGGEFPGRGGLTRDYYRVESDDGRRYWLFRHGLYHESPTVGWYLHGLLP